MRHELLMLPYFGVFDYIAYKVDGGNVYVWRSVRVSIILGEEKDYGALLVG